MKPLNISIPDELREYLTKRSADNYESISAYIRRLVQDDKRRLENSANESATA